jgi:hypothetical protein
VVQPQRSVVVTKVPAAADSCENIRLSSDVPNR